MEQQYTDDQYNSELQRIQRGLHVIDRLIPELARIQPACAELSEIGSELLLTHGARGAQNRVEDLHACLAAQSEELQAKRRRIVHERCSPQELGRILDQLRQLSEMDGNRLGVQKHKLANYSNEKHLSLVTAGTGSEASLRTGGIDAEVLFNAYNCRQLEVRNVLHDYFEPAAFELLDQLSANLYWMLAIAYRAVRALGYDRCLVQVKHVREAIRGLFPNGFSLPKLDVPVESWSGPLCAQMLLAGVVLLTEYGRGGKLVINPIVTELFGKTSTAPAAPQQS